MIKLTKEQRLNLINELTKQLKEDASTGLSNRIINQINFKSLAVSAVLVIEREIFK